MIPEIDWFSAWLAFGGWLLIMLLITLAFLQEIFLSDVPNEEEDNVRP